MSYNPVANAKAPRPADSQARELQPSEGAALLAVAANEKDAWSYQFFVVCLSTGMRRAEVAALCWDCVDEDGGVLYVKRAFGEDRQNRRQYIKETKAKRVRGIQLNPSAVEAFRKMRGIQTAYELAAGHGMYNRYATLRDGDGNLIPTGLDKDGNRIRLDTGTKKGNLIPLDLVFSDKHGSPIRLDLATKNFRRLAKLAGLTGVNLHSTRHSAASWSLASGTDLKQVSTLLGHLNPNLTLRTYAHIIEARQAQAVTAIEDTLVAAQARHLAEKNRNA